MYNVTQQFLNVIKGNGREFKATVTIRDTTFNDNSIIDFSVNENVNPADSFMLGSVASNVLEINITNIPDTLILDGAKVVPLLGINTGSVFEDVPLGIFWVDDIEKSKNSLKLTCVDNMIKLEKAYFSNLSYPASINSVAQEICTKAGVELTSVLPSTNINEIEGCTYREAISFIASFLGGFARFNRLGKLEIISYTDTTIQVTGDNFFSLKTNERPFTIGRLTCKANDKNLTAGTSGNEIQFENPIMTQTQLNSIYNNLKNLIYMPFSMEWQGNHALQAGDKITITDTNGNSYYTLLMQQKLNYKGALSANASAVGKTEQAQEFSSSGSIKNTVNKMVIEQADIKLLLAEKATIEDLTATNAKIDNLVVDTAHIADASIDTAKIKDASITNAKIGLAAIDTANIKIGAITNALIGAAAIDTANIKNGIITNALIADSTITNAKIANSTITNAEIANATITGAKIGTATITTANIATGTITSANIQDATIVNGDIANATITGAKIANATINTANIADAAITSAKIADANITSAKIATASITTALIADAAITNAKIGLLAVDTANIADAAITNAKIGLLAVTSANIADATITSAKIASATITAANIANATITSANIAIGTITSANIHDATIVNGDIANATITGAKIANATIATANIVDAAITTAKIADANITSSKIANATITTALIADASITNAKIGLLAVATGNIADAAITNAKIGLLAVTTANIVDASISTAKIADAAITSVKITDASITNAKIASLAVATGNIQDAAITNAKIGLLAVTSANIVDATIGTAKIADTAITTAKIANANITTAKIASANITTALIADAAITNAKIGLLAVTAANISDATITSGKIASATITAANIANATITAAQIANATITGAKIASATISSANIVDATITGADIANATITSANIGNATITGANIASATIGTANIASGAIGTAQIATGAITTALISNAAIGTTQIADGSITNAKIVSLTADKITTSTLDTSKVTIQGTNGKLRMANNRIQVFDNQTTPIERVSMGDVNGDGSIYGLRIRGADGTTILMDENGVKHEGITDGAITNSKISSNADINGSKLLDNSISGGKLVVDSITAREIATGAITANEIAANTITGAKIAAGTITAANIATGAITTSQLASNVGSSLDISSNTSITSRVTTNTYNQGISDAKEIALATELGKMLYLDPTFKNGNNGICVYNNAGGGTVTHARISSPTGCPTTSGYCLQIITTGTASPGLGGFCFATASRANAIFIVKILANIPVGSNINFASNSYGTGGSQKWLTSQAGTGNWEEYICKVTCGSAGTFSRTNFFYINTGTLPFTWYVAYATVFDMTDVDGKTNSAEIISTINQSAESIGISASRIAITGSVTLSSWSHVSDVTKIDGGDIYTNSITATQIAAGTITAASGIIADAAITNAKIANSAITAAKIADATITSAEIASGTITAANIASATITNAQIATGTITSANILDGTISNAEIANATITGAKIASATITTGNIATANITTALIADGSITNAKIASLSVDAAKITDATITASKIVNATITGAKIASATITSANIASATITAANIQDAAITTAKIQDASITDAKITSLNASKIIAASITVDKLASNVGSSLDISANNSITLKADKSYVDNMQIGGRNYCINGSFKNIGTNANIGWDNTLNGTTYPTKGWSSGYSSGVTSPTIGYHAHINSSVFGYPVIEFIDRNSEYGYGHRWLGISQTFATTSEFAKSLKTGATVTISFEVYSDTVGSLIGAGLYHYEIGNLTPSFFNTIGNTAALTSTETWEKKSLTFTINSAWDFTKPSTLYLYGHFSSVECSQWIRNVKVESGDKATDFVLAIEDIPDNTNIISTINLSPEVIQIQANKIQISGSVTLSDWTYSGLTTINGAKVQTGTITADKLTANTITADSGIIADAAITTAKIDNLSVDSTKIADAAIDTAKIKDAAITNAKIKDADITTAKIKDAAITTAKIIDGSITNAKIVDASITNAKILSLDATKITTGYLDADRIAAGTITADKLQVGSGSISSSNLCLGKSFSSPTAYMNVTTITVASNVGDRSLTVASTSSMVIGTTIRIGTEVFTITDINSLVITLSSTLTVAYANGTSVYYQNLLYANDGVNSVGSGYTVFGAGSMNNNAAEGAYLQVDLGAVYRIAESRLFFYGSDTRYYYYKIKYSEDGNNWCYAVGNPNVTGWNVSAPSSSGYPKHNPTIDKFAVQITARYLRVYGNGNSVNNGNHIYEWELYSTGQTIINGGQIKTGTITAAQIAADTITAASGILADASITTANIADGTITSAKIANATITGADIANATITNTNIANATIRTAQIASAAITTALIGDGAITTAKIADATITTAKIADATITTAKIADATITTAKIADASITSAKIISLDANKINAGTITGALIKTSNTSDYIHMQNQSLIFYKGTSQRMFLGFDGGNNAAIELGILTAASTPHIDFHSGTGGSDYDSRIEAFNGYSTTGRGDLAVIAKNFYFYPNGRTGTVHLVVNSPNIGKLNMIAGTDKYVEVYAGTAVYGITAWVSDAKFKKNIYDTDVTALDKVMSIKHRKFDWKENNKHIELGYVAQELQQVDKGFVFGVKQENGSETLNPNANTLIPYLSKAIQELKVLVDKQADEIKKLKAKIK